MSNRTNEELEALYKAGHGQHHHQGLREVYQAGRADEAQDLRDAVPPPPAEPAPSVEEQPQASDTEAPSAAAE
jgi:hypothetical protein